MSERARELLVVGLNHKTAPIEVREKIAFPEDQKSLKELVQVDGVHEGLILSTCNRVELCMATDEPERATRGVKKFISDYHGESLERLIPHLYTLSNKEAVRHTFRVAASLDSLVIGENQILAQVKHAYHLAKEAQTLGPILHRFFHKTFSVAKRVRTETNLGAQKCSVSSVAVDLAKKIFDRLETRVILLIGAGEMMEGATARFIEKGVTQFYVTNRSLDRVATLSETFKQKAQFKFIPLVDMPSCLDKVDIIFVSASSPTYLLTSPMVQKSVETRHHRPLLCIDISVPRNADPLLHKIEDVFLYDIDDLDDIIKVNSIKRLEKARVAEEIISSEADRFYEKLLSLRLNRP